MESTHVHASKHDDGGVGVAAAGDNCLEGRLAMEWTDNRIVQWHCWNDGAAAAAVVDDEVGVAAAVLVESRSCCWPIVQDFVAPAFDADAIVGVDSAAVDAAAGHDNVVAAAAVDVDAADAGADVHVAFHRHDCYCHRLLLHEYLHEPVPIVDGSIQTRRDSEAVADAAAAGDDVTCSVIHSKRTLDPCSCLVH